MKTLLFSATLMALVLPVGLRADVAPSQAQVEQIVTGSGVVDSRAGKYQGSRGGAR